jgi:apolipoprotein N-acyltransferase
MDLKRRTWLFGFFAIVTSAVAYFYGTGLHPRWYLMWIAPLPVLMFALRSSRRWAAAAAFLAYSLGGLNMLHYYRLVTPIPVTLLILLTPSAFLAGIVVVFSIFASRGHLVRATFAVPVLWVAVEFVTEMLSPHSTFGNLAYTQMDFVSILQIVSIAGIWSISFLLFLVPASLAAMTAPRVSSGQKAFIAVSTLSIVCGVVLFGVHRLHTDAGGKSVTVGLLATDTTVFARGPAAVELVRRYAAQVPLLKSGGAEVIVIPEKIGGFSEVEVAATDRILKDTAKLNAVTIVAGLQHLPNLNELRVYGPDGQFEAAYEKHHMLPAFEADLLPGTTRVNMDMPSGRWGFTICKDMDFPKLSREYGRDGAGLLIVPAWDFVQDGWLHGRMAILRGVESGFSIARAPKQGILTVTDSRGRVLSEQQTGESTFSSVVATVRVANQRTFYARNGDWFAWLDTIFALLLLLLLWMWPRGADLPAATSDGVKSGVQFTH